MVEGFNPIRYSVIEDKNPREIVMLVGDGLSFRFKQRHRSQFSVE